MILLDTCTLIWLTSDLARISERAKGRITEFRDSLHVSPVSALEIALKRRKRKLALPLDTERWFQNALNQHGLAEIALSSKTAIASTELQALHEDPFDRILVATAMEQNLILLTPDRLISQYPGVCCEW